MIAPSSSAAASKGVAASVLERSLAVVACLSEPFEALATVASGKLSTNAS